MSNAVARRRRALALSSAIAGALAVAAGAVLKLPQPFEEPL